MNAALPVRVDVTAVQSAQILGRQTRGIGGIRELLVGEALQETLDLFIIHGETPDLAARQARLAADPRQDGRPLLGSARVGFVRCTSLLYVSILVQFAEGLVHVGVVQAAPVRDDVFDVELRVRTEQRIHADLLSSVWAHPAAFLGQQVLQDIVARRGPDPVLYELRTGPFSRFLVVPVPLDDVLSALG